MTLETLLFQILFKNLTVTLMEQLAEVHKLENNSGPVSMNSYLQPHL